MGLGGKPKPRDAPSKVDKFKLSVRPASEHKFLIQLMAKVSGPDCLAANINLKSLVIYKLLK